MKYYVVIDTNVLVSAVLKSHSVPGSIVELAFDGPIIPILNEAIEKEYREVLSRPKFHLPEDLIEGIMSTFLFINVPFMSMPSILTLNCRIPKISYSMKWLWKNKKRKRLIL